MIFAAFGACGRNMPPMNMPKKGRVAGARNIPELPHPFFQDKTLMLFGD